jgi:hypothetical protein
MALGFTEAGLDQSQEDWATVERYNSCLERLLNRRKIEILVEGPLVESKKGLEVFDAPTSAALPRHNAGVRLRPRQDAGLRGQIIGLATLREGSWFGAFSHPEFGVCHWEPISASRFHKRVA